MTPGWDFCFCFFLLVVWGCVWVRVFGVCVLGGIKDSFFSVVKRKVWPEWKLLPGCHLWCVMDESLNGCFPSESRRWPASLRSLTAPGTAEVTKQAFYSRDFRLSRPFCSISAALCAVGSEARSLREETQRKSSDQSSNTIINSSVPQTQRWRSLQFISRTWTAESCCQNDCSYFMEDVIKCVFKNHDDINSQINYRLYTTVPMTEVPDLFLNWTASVNKLLKTSKNITAAQKSVRTCWTYYGLVLTVFCLECFIECEYRKWNAIRNYSRRYQL